MLKSAAIVFGIVFLALGILGYFPALAPGGMLFGIFHVDAVHNLVHILSGVVALVAGVVSVAASRLFFQVFGIIYGVLAIWGAFVGEGYILGIVSNNIHIVWLHAIIALVALYFGFVASAAGRPKTGETL